MSEFGAGVSFGDFTWDFIIPLCVIICIQYFNHYGGSYQSVYFLLNSLEILQSVEFIPIQCIGTPAMLPNAIAVSNHESKVFGV